MSAPLIWIVLGLVLILAEFAVPGLVVIFFGIGALAVGLLVWAGMPTTGGLPFVVFAVISVGALLLLRRKCRHWFTGDIAPVEAAGLDGDFVGHEATVVSGFDEGSPGRGVVLFRGTRWSARSEQALGADQVVTIRDRAGSVLQVGRAD